MANISWYKLWNGILGHELCDGHVLYVFWGVGVQRGHLRVGHELCDEHGVYVLWGVGMA